MGDGALEGVVGWPRSQLFEGRGGEAETLTCSGFQGIPGPALVGGESEKPLEEDPGSPTFFSVETALPAPPLTLSFPWPQSQAMEDGEFMQPPFL